MTGPVLRFAELPSTQDEAKRLWAEGAADGTIVLADVQTQGRGRRGRAWVGARGNLHGSMILRGFPTLLPLRAGVALAESLRDMGVAATLKWPNDALVDGAKLAGMLIEAEGGDAILGLGVNIAAHPDGLAYPATSLAALGVEADPVELIEAFRARLQAGRGMADGAVVSAWSALAHPPGTRLKIVSGEETICGGFAGLDEGGSLRLTLDDGRERRFAAAEVIAT